HSMVLPRMGAVRKKDRIVLHPVCSLEKMKSAPAFLAIANYFAEDVHVPMNSGCCGMAGDRGFLIPELTASATKPEAAEVCAQPADGFYSSTRTCEMAMEEATNKNYESILYLVDESVD
ncbi:MAG TPA: FAD-binding oxidoreductase, partial [Catalimonadaceae bacterium]|nr:FAD-binding oxidoreductase [Catalimonadaceae bacterium]